MEQEKLFYEEENEAKINALSALAETASSLSRAVNKIATYVPTQWVDNSEPSINATRLMHIENGIRDATNALNNAIDAVTANSTAINKINSDFNKYGFPTNENTVTNLHNLSKTCFFGYESGAVNSPVSDRGGLGICIYHNSNWIDVLVIPYAQSQIYITHKYNNWTEWLKLVTNSDLALNNTKIESRSDSSSLSITVTDITNGEALYIGYAKSSGEYRLNHKSTTGSWDGEKKIITS